MPPRLALFAVPLALALALPTLVASAVARAPAPSASASAPAPSPLPAASASPLDSDDALPPHAERVVDYTLKASLDPVAHSLHGEGTIHWRNASNVVVRELWLHLYLNAFKNERSVFLREPVGQGRGMSRPSSWGSIDVRKLTLREGVGGAPADLWAGAELHRPDDTDETDVRVPLPRDVAPGEVITLDMIWDDVFPSIVERTGFDGSFHMVGQWFPKLARLEANGRWAHFPFHHLAEFYADFGTYDVTLDVPKSFLIGATGPVVETRVEGDRRIERHVQGDIHDFAFTAWDQWQTASERIDDVNVTLLYPPGFRVVALRELAVMRFTLPHFRERYGRYPYPTLTMVHPPESASEAGGMEYPTLITTGGPWYGPPGVHVVELVTVHEFAHQYFYGLVASDEVAWPFLDEGLTSFATSEALSAWRGNGSLVDLAGLTISEIGGEAVGSNQAVHNEPVAQPAYTFANGFDYGRLVYGRTAAIVETLRRVYGDPIVGRAIGRYARKYRFRHPTPDEFLATFEEIAGAPMRETLRVALFEKGWVDFVATGIEDAEVRDAAGIFDREGKRETVTAGAKKGGHEGSVLVIRRGTLRIPVEIELTLADGTKQRVTWNGEGDSTRIPYSGNVALRSAVVDPDERVLLDTNRRNNHASVGGRGGGVARTSERLFYWAQLLLQAVAP